MLAQFRSDAEATRKGIELLMGAEAAMKGFRGDVNGTVQMLLGRGMQSPSGKVWANAVGQWLMHFGRVEAELAGLRQALEDTQKAYAATEARNTDLAKFVSGPTGNSPS